MTDQLALADAAAELSAQHEWPAAALAWAAVVERNPVNGAYRHQLAETLVAAGDDAGALTAYRKALELGVWPVRGMAPEPAVLPLPGELAYRIAACHARLGDTGAALAGLAEARRLGLRDPDRAGTDDSFAGLHGDPRLAAAVGCTEHSGLSRVDGWRSDVDLLVAEARRRVPFPERVDAAFDAAAAELRDRVPELTDAQVTVGLWGLLRRLGDGHAGLDVSEAFPRWVDTLPVWFYPFAEGMFIPDTDPRYAELRGTELIAVDGHPVAEVLAALDPMIPRDNEWNALSTAPIRLRQPAWLHALGITAEPDRARLTVRHAGGSTGDTTVTAEPDANRRTWPRQCPHRTVDAGTPRYLRDPDTPYWFEHLAGPNLVWWQFNGVGDMDGDPLAAFYRRLFAAVDEHDAGLVIDLRWNGGGDTFLTAPLIQQITRRDRLNRRGRLFVLTGRHTFSAAQNTATFLDRWTSAVFVGEPTGSSPNFVGETIPFRLPYSGVRANISDLYWQTSWPLDHRTAIAPDIYAPPTWTAYTAGRDPAYDAILAHLGQPAAGAAAEPQLIGAG